jgi:PASTA domain
MTVPWLGIQKIAVVPTFNTVFDGPPPPDWDYLVMSRVLYDPDPDSGKDRSLRAYINALSYGQAIVNVEQFPHAFSDGPSVIEAAWQSLPPGHDCPYVLCVIPWADGDLNRIGYFESVGQNGVIAAARVAMYDYLPTKTRQITGVWAMELLHAMVGWPDLYKAHGTKMGDWDNMTYNAGTHSCAHLKLRPGWLAATDIAYHGDGQQDYDLQSLSTMPPPPGRFAAVRIRSTVTGNVFMAEARLKSDVYERGFAPLTPIGQEFRGLPGEGVIVYQTHDDLQETLFMGGPLGVGDTYDDTAEGFAVNVLHTIEEGMTVRVSTAPDTRPEVPDVLELKPAIAAHLVEDAGLVAKFTGAIATNSAHVATQSPTEGTRVSPGSTVTMFLKRGPTP